MGVRSIESMGSQSGKPRRPILIQNCGEVGGNRRKANMYHNDRDRDSYRGRDKNRRKSRSRSRSRSPVKKGVPRSKVELDNEAAAGRFEGYRKQDPIKDRMREIRDGSGLAGAPRKWNFDENEAKKNWKNRTTDEILERITDDGFKDREENRETNRVATYTS